MKDKLIEIRFIGGIPLHFYLPQSAIGDADLLMMKNKPTMVIHLSNNDHLEFLKRLGCYDNENLCSTDDKPSVHPAALFPEPGNLWKFYSEGRVAGSFAGLFRS
jgi:hypothetical protein